MTSSVQIFIFSFIITIITWINDYFLGKISLPNMELVYVRTLLMSYCDNRLGGQQTYQIIFVYTNIQQQYFFLWQYFCSKIKFISMDKYLCRVSCFITDWKSKVLNLQNNSISYLSPSPSLFMRVADIFHQEFCHSKV